MGLVASFSLARMKLEEKGNWDNNCAKTGSAETSWSFPNGKNECVRFLLCCGVADSTSHLHSTDEYNFCQLYEYLMVVKTFQHHSPFFQNLSNIIHHPQMIKHHLTGCPNVFNLPNSTVLSGVE